MKIGMICKYPPIVGGVSSKAFWMSKALAELGHEIHIITNAQEVESTYKEIFSLKDIDDNLRRPNLFIHATPQNDVPFYIPKGNPFEVKLANLAVEVIQQFQLEILDCWYFIPNGFAGYLAHSITKIPWIIRHAGSDLGRILPHHLFKTILKSIIIRADKIVTQKSSAKLLLSHGVSKEKLWFNSKVSVNTNYFTPNGKRAANLPRDKPVILSIGKIGNVKGTFDLLRSFAPLKDRAYLVYVTGGPGIEKIQGKIKLLGLKNSVKILPPIPPWQVPDYFRGSRCVVHIERDFPIIFHRPILPREIMACGKCMILSEEMYSKYNFLKDSKNVLVVDPHNHNQLTETLKDIILSDELSNKIGSEALTTSCKIEDFSGYIAENVKLYSSLIQH